MSRKIRQKPRKRRVASPAFPPNLPRAAADGLVVAEADGPSHEVTAGLQGHPVQMTWTSVLRDRFIYLILVLPVLVLSWNTNYIYSPAGSIDPWVYYGYMRHLKEMKVMFPGTYYGSRLPWILPGALIRTVLPSIPANYFLHLTVFFTAVFSVYWILKTAFEARVAVLSAILLASYPYFWAAIGWDYVDGVGIAYYLLTMAFLSGAASRRQQRGLLIAAGVAYAGMIYVNMVWIAFSPMFFVFYLWMVPEPIRRIWRPIVRFFFWFGLGWAAITAVLGGINRIFEPIIWFYYPSVRYALSTVGVKNAWKAANYAWVLDGHWLILPVLGSIAALVVCGKRSWRTVRGDAKLFFAFNLIYSFGIMAYMDGHGNPVLQFSYYASYLIPSTILVLGPVVFASVSTLEAPRFRFVIGAAIASLLLIWAGCSNPTIATFIRGHMRTLLAWSIGMTAAGIVLRRSIAATLLALTGLTMVGLCSNSVNVSAPHSGAQAYQRIAAGMEAVEHARNSRPVRFWFNGDDPSRNEFNSISSCYLWGYTIVGFEFPALDQKTSLADGTLLIVPSSKPDVAQEAARTLSEHGSIATLERKVRIESGGQGYWLHFFKVSSKPVTTTF